MERIISNAEIGARIRLFRKQKNLTQMQLAERVGVSFQQIQKYEKGRDRICVERLQQIARAMGIPISYFLQILERFMLFRKRHLIMS
ncbi:MAG: helix-turn-helix protein [Candidatus Methanoperedenaceae archaeon GB50]|nr:MAG: helix-turn-helix protein [Candidatus Methanoperedenaceae archaeon GB50]